MADKLDTRELDPIRFEVFFQRLRSLLEEGREAVAMVSGSPGIVEGGECMTSIYDGDGNAILTASGTLFHVMGSADAILKTIEWDSEDPGIHDGDQIYYGDVYIAGTHLMDQIMIRPIFHEGRRVGWVGTMTHTADIGGLLRGITTEIFHEGIRIRGLKMVERGKLRPDLLRVVVEQCRDPDYVALDIMARIASNNVCAQGYLDLINRFGVEFVEAAARKLREDAEKKVREKLLSLPDGTWRNRIYWSNTEREGTEEKYHPFKVMVTMTKKGDRLSFDATGTSPQNKDYRNATFAAARSQLFVTVAGFIFWDIPWNAGMANLVDLTIPEGTILNCRFPASCGLGTLIGGLFTDAAIGTVARMLYAGGQYDAVNSAWSDSNGSGPQYWYGGHNQHGGIIGSAIYDLFAAGNGATPNRDGTDTGGGFFNAKSAVSDIEWIEMYYPFLYLARRNCPGSGGYGKYRGGNTVESIRMAYGSEDLSVDYMPSPKGAEVRSWGLFGGYPTGDALGGNVMLVTPPNILEILAQGKYPTAMEELGPPWGIIETKDPDFRYDRTLGGIRIDVPPYSILGLQFGPGGGYGDPLDRDPMEVLQDVKDDAIHFESAAKVYGVVINPDTLEVDLKKTEERRQEIRQERLSKGERLTPAENIIKVEPSAKKSLMRIHEYLEIVEKDGGEKAISCLKCGYVFCPPGDNYKKYALRWTKDPREMKQVPEGEPTIMYYQEYICPGCGVLLQVDTWCPLIDSDEPLWDIDVEV